MRWGAVREQFLSLVGTPLNSGLWKSEVSSMSTRSQCRVSLVQIAHSLRQSRLAVVSPGSGWCLAWVGARLTILPRASPTMSAHILYLLNVTRLYSSSQQAQQSFDLQTIANTAQLHTYTTANTAVIAAFQPPSMSSGELIVRLNDNIRRNGRKYVGITLASSFFLGLMVSFALNPGTTNSQTAAPQPFSASEQTNLVAAHKCLPLYGTQRISLHRQPLLPPNNRIRGLSTHVSYAGEQQQRHERYRPQSRNTMT